MTNCNSDKLPESINLSFGRTMSFSFVIKDPMQTTSEDEPNKNTTKEVLESWSIKEAHN